MTQTLAKTRPFPFATVERLWPNETVVCIGGGPSLTQADVDYCRGKARVIVINNGYLLAPWADVLYACDRRWYEWHKGVPSFTGLKYSLQTASARWPGVQVLNNTGTQGLELKPKGLRTGRNSGFQCLNLAYHFGVSRILLLGYDLQRTYGRGHWHEEHPNGQPSPLGSFRGMFDTIKEPLKQAGVEVINCSVETALETFHRRPLREALR